MTVWFLSKFETELAGVRFPVGAILDRRAVRSGAFLGMRYLAGSRILVFEQELSEKCERLDRSRLGPGSP